MSLTDLGSHLVPGGGDPEPTPSPDDGRIRDRDEIAALLNDYYGQTDPTGQGQFDEEYFDMLPQEMQWLVEDEATFRSLVRDYLNGDITFEQLQEFELSDYGDAGTRFVDFYNEAMSLLQPADTTVEEAEEEVSLDMDPDLTGTVQVFEEGVPYILNLPEMDRPPISEADVLPIEITEPEVTFEEPAGGGGAEAAPAEETAPAEEEEAAAEEEPLSTVEVPAGQPSPVVDLQHQWVYVGNGTFRNIVTGEEITIFIDPDFEDPYEEGRVYSRGDEIPVTDVSPEQEEPEEEPSLIEEIMTIPMPASDMVDVIIDDTVTPPEPVPEPEETVETPTETPTTPADTVVETPVETPAEGEEQAGEAGQEGTDTGQVGTGQDGADGGEGGLGGLGGLGMFAGLGEPPGEFTQPEPFKRVSLGYRPVQMERARLFDYMDYNPLRNIR